MNNKRIYLLILVVGALSTMTSCKKFLDLPPKNQRAVESIADLKSVLGGYLYGLRSTNPIPMANTGQLPIVSEQQMMLFESYSDNIDFEKAMPTYVNASNISAKELFYADHFLWNDYSTPAGIWKNYYTTIGFLNALIDQLPELKDGTAIEQKQLEGEMLMQRSYYLFKLLQYFAPYHDDRLGIPMYLHTGLEVVNIEMKRRSQKEIYTQIIADLQRVLSNLEVAQPDQNYNIFYNKLFGHNLLAQIYWFKAESAAKESDDYKFAEQHATAAIEGTEVYIPKTALELQNVQQGLNSAYPAYYHRGRLSGGIQAIYGSIFAYIGFLPYDIPVSQDLLSLFDAGDIRKSLYFSGQTINSGWPDGKANGQKYVQFNLFTPEEAYLILSESYLRQGNLAESERVLNVFKSFRQVTAVNSLTKEALLQEIVNERRKEFFAKTDMRWLDLKRYGNKTLKRNLKFFNKDYRLTVEPNDYHYALPIPVDEVQQNKAIEPNAGWNVIIY
ncbi:RagB/SusD family nutrient uptake outer membrane protein [Sphingobacterium sp.]|uniref:RagB/SusD family nutrient uptake outer membrane protein n=1 Tax=Sphingobacterium sp. TaxID=341027 RepID=UPI0031DA90EC